MASAGDQPDQRREAGVDALGLALIGLLLLDYLRPALLFLPTITTGGDTPCHYPTAAFLRERLLPQLRFHGWYAGAYLGHPLLLYYFPLPFVVIAALSPLFGPAVAFKLGTALAAAALPFAAYAAFRLLGFRFPTPLMGAAAATLFLFVEDNPIWGASIASMLTGEFAYGYGTALGLLFLGVAYRAYSRGQGPLLPALALAATAFAHGYAVLWAGLSASYFLYASRRPLRTLVWLLRVGGLALGCVAFWLLPLLADWGWTTPFNDAWLSVSWRNLLPPTLWPPLLAAAAGILATLALWRRQGGPDHRFAYLLHAALVAGALAAAGPVLGIIDVRFAPFAHLALALAGAAALGEALRRLARPAPAALGVLLLALLLADARTTFLRGWIDWNYTGLEARELWPDFSRVAQALRGSGADPRATVEYSKLHERAGSIRMYETLPYFSGRSTLEGVYNQASLNTHAIYYLTSELCELSPNPFRNVEFSKFDTEAALAHLRLFNTRDVVAVSERLIEALRARPDVREVAAITPYHLFRLEGRFRYVEPLEFEPVRTGEAGWRDKAQRWFSSRPLPRVPLVFTDDPRFPEAPRGTLARLPERPLPAGVSVVERVGEEAIEIETSRVGHPLLVKVSWHPRWRALGADGPYRVAPALMLVVPRQPQVRLEYASGLSDHVGHALTLCTLFGAAFAWWQTRRRRTASAPAPEPLGLVAILERAERDRPGLRWGGLIPGGLLLLLLLSRLLT
ncbi:MAG: 6-pyruvoyl-tetrahydropterin synthase-related protein [Vicinamibacteria bacterium]